MRKCISILNACELFVPFSPSRSLSRIYIGARCMCSVLWLWICFSATKSINFHLISLFIPFHVILSFSSLLNDCLYVCSNVLLRERVRKSLRFWFPWCVLTVCMKVKNVWWTHRTECFKMCTQTQSRFLSHYGDFGWSVVWVSIFTIETINNHRPTDILTTRAIELHSSLCLSLPTFMTFEWLERRQKDLMTTADTSSPKNRKRALYMSIAVAFRLMCVCVWIAMSYHLFCIVTPTFKRFWCFHHNIKYTVRNMLKHFPQIRLKLH